MKKITHEQICTFADELGVEVACLQAVREVECRSNGFNADGTPVILFERHVFWQQLTKRRYLTIRNTAHAKHPNICHPKSGAYGKYAEQHKRLGIACDYDRECGLMSASWGCGQVMGYHWKSLGYESLQAFINAMYKDEASQLDAMCRYIRINGLIPFLQNKDWAGFAKRYNGIGYKKNAYDVKLAQAYQKFAR